MEINFIVTIEEANLIGAALRKLPFEAVVSLIGKLEQQAQAQLQPPPMPVEDEESE